MVFNIIEIVSKIEEIECIVEFWTENLILTV